MAGELARSKVNRNTAVAMKDQVLQPISGLFADDIAVGTTILGFDPTHEAHEAAVYAAESGESDPPEDYRDTPFLLYAWMAKKIQLADQVTGDPQPAVRVVLMSPGGKMMAATSMGVVLSLDLIRTFRGDGPYDPPIPVRVVETKTRRGFRLYRLVPTDLRGNRAAAQPAG